MSVPLVFFFIHSKYAYPACMQFIFISYKTYIFGILLPICVLWAFRLVLCGSRWLSFKITMAKKKNCCSSLFFHSFVFQRSVGISMWPFRFTFNKNNESNIRMSLNVHVHKLSWSERVHGIKRKRCDTQELNERMKRRKKKNNAQSIKKR